MDSDRCRLRGIDEPQSENLVLKGPLLKPDGYRVRSHRNFDSKAVGNVGEGGMCRPKIWGEN